MKWRKLAVLFSLLSTMAPHAAASGQPGMPVNVYIAPFANRGNVDPDIVASFRDLFEESFESALTSNGLYKVLNRDAIDDIVSAAKNEEALSSISDIKPAVRSQLKISKADGVIFGQVVDDKDSGDVRVAVKLQSLDSSTYWNKSVTMKRGLIHDLSSRTDAMQQLVRLVVGSLQGNGGKAESADPSSKTNRSLESSTGHSNEKRVRDCVTPPKGLVGWWPGDGNMNDIIGGHNPSDSTGVSYLPGEVGYGFTFGIKAWIRIPTSPPLENQRFTWAAWVRVDGPGSRNDNLGSVILGQVIGAIGIPAVVPVQMAWRPMDDKFVFLFGDPKIDRIVSQHSYPPGSFYFVAAEYDGHQYRLIINGVLEGGMNLAQSVPYSSSTPWIFGQGGLWALDSFPRTWNGVIDEVQAFNRDLTQSEIEEIYNAGARGECKPAN